MLFGAAFSAMLASACSGEEAVPDLVYTVNVTSAVDSDGQLSSGTTCIGEGETVAALDEDYTYELFFEGANVEVRVDGESFAAGVREGCDLVYESAVWLEERSSGDLRWRLNGEAIYEGAAGGCDLADGSDWSGSEVIEIVESEDEDVAEGCTYEMVTEGTLQAG
jgi:hypothetical protein